MSINESFYVCPNCGHTFAPIGQTPHQHPCGECGEVPGDGYDTT